MTRIGPLAAVAAVAGLAACSPVYVAHGYAPPAAEVEQIKPGVDTRATVAEKIGRPGLTGAFTNDGWYYVASTVEKEAFYAPATIDRRVVAVTFTPDGVVKTVNTYGMDHGKVVDLVARTTPTYGQQLTVLQQIFGNIGRYDSGTNPLSGNRASRGTGAIPGQ